MKTTKFVAALAVLAIAGCSGDGSTDPIVNPTGNFRFVSGVHGTVNVLVDGTPVLSNVALGGYVGADVAPGQHTVAIQKVGGGTSVGGLVTMSGTTHALVVGSETGGTLHSNVFVDTNAVVPAGATKLRVAHFAATAAPITAWRTQPDFGTMIRVQFPFPYNAVSPYLQSTPGDWRVMISSEENTAGSVPMPDTLANSGLIPIASGASRTVVVVDGPTAGSVKLVVVEP
jgi:hypothetical protein